MVIYCVLSPVLVLLEEAIDATQYYRIVRSVSAFSNKEWNDLTEEEKIKMEKFYKFLEYRNDRRLQIMARESSIQLVYQNAIVLYQFRYPPVRELDFSSILQMISSLNFGQLTSAHTIWILQLTLQIISIGLSAYSTFNPIMEYTAFRTFKNHQKHVSIISSIVKAFQLLFHIIYSSGVVYLSWVIKYIISVF